MERPPGCVVLSVGGRGTSQNDECGQDHGEDAHGVIMAGGGQGWQACDGSCEIGLAWMAGIGRMAATCHTDAV